ncbi:MAG: Calx-beta domain-containing protein, partial [Desulfuromonadales bacterium]|nr:Calx-beta domain-containing protein [Desulfuromonadales bacterium]
NSALLGDDYTANDALTGTLTFAANETEKTITLNIEDDDVYELTENFNVNLSNADGATITDVAGEDVGTGTILDDDDQPVFSIDDVTVTEGVDATITFTVTKTGLTSQESSVDYTVVPNSALLGDDYTANDALTGTLTFAANETTKTITLNITDDAIPEDTETFNVNLSNADGATITDVVGEDVGTGTILDSDIPDFPSGLAYTVAGSKSAAGQHLYSVDLETGETTRIGEVTAEAALGQNSVGGMSLNPIDGYLYAVANSQGGSWLLKIDPTTAETTVIDSGNFVKTSAATFGADGTYYVAIGQNVYIYDLENPGEAPDPNNDNASWTHLFYTGKNSIQADSIAVYSDPDTGDATEMYFTDGTTLYKYDFAGDSVSTIGTIEDVNSDAFSINGLSFDDNGTLWGLDDLGTIVEIDPVTAEATEVSTLANSDVTGGGTDSLAISVADPGSYVTISDGTDSSMYYLPDDDTGDSIPAPPADVTIDSDGSGNVFVGQENTDYTSVSVQSDNAANITVGGDNPNTGDVETENSFDTVNVQVRGEGASNITVNDASTGMIDSGEGNDVITVNSGNFTIYADGGDDTINLSSASSTDHVVFSANAGEGSDIINNFDTAEDTLSFADLLDEGVAGLDDDLAAYTDYIDVVSVDGGDVTLTIHNQSGGPETTEVTLAGAGSDYGDFSGTLTDMISTFGNDAINVDTYAS